jgi:Cu2+-exporting ATPase
VRAARVNLTLKRAIVDVDENVDAQPLADHLTRTGFEAYELDPAQLRSTQTDRKGKDLLMRLGVSGFAMMNVMLLSVAVWSGASDATRDMFHWISAAIAIPTVGFSSQVFFRSAWQALRAGRLNMDVPISLAILLALGMSVYETAQSGEHAYFDAALSLTFFLLAGRYLDHRTRAVARSAAEELAALEVPRALRVVAGQADDLVDVSQLSIGDVIRVVPGARIPVDGVIITGASELDRSLLTGESLPVAVAPESQVSAGEVNLTGPLTIAVKAAGRDSSLHKMAELVAIAETARNRYTSLADKAARIYAPVVHLLALAAFLGWLWISADWRIAMNVAVAVLIITCPCALGLAVPAVSTAVSGRLFKHGMLLKSATAMERLAEVDCVVFDKTGTLTKGTPIPDDLAMHNRETLAIALGLAEGSQHPLAQSLTHSLNEAGVKRASISNIRELPGKGIEGEWQGQTVRLGRGAWLGATQLSQTATYLSVGDQQPVGFAFSDALRPGAQDAVRALQNKGIEVSLISGDVAGAVSDIADKIGIADWQAAQLPQDKAQYIAGLKAQGKKVLMVGDGLNDTAALAGAHVSISPASALEAARVVSDIVLLGGSLEPLAETIDLAKSARRRIKENFAIAAGYNAIAVPIAVLGLATPLAAALTMSTSSVLVSLNALRLRKVKT